MIRHKAWMLGALAPLPFLSLYLVHFLKVSETIVPTGFLQTDMAYYSANGREIFEGGNGWLYPNPYNVNGETIYFHWFPWLLGVGIKFIGLEPGAQYVAYGIVAALLLSLLTYRLVCLRLPDPQYRGVIFLLSMWGGGFLALGKIILNITQGLPIYEKPLLFDPGNGYWLLSWGRNTIYTTEAVYHCLFAAAWLFLLKKRWWMALLCTALLAGTHPFSGVQLLLIVIAYLYVVSILKMEELPAAPRLASLALFALFAGYYFWFLGQFESHRAIQGGWQIEWTLPWDTLLLHEGWLVVLVLVGFWRIQKKPSSSEWLFIISALISLGLAKHDLFITPHQPLHFTRGYLWMPLFLLAAPVLQKGLIRLQDSLPGMAARLVTTLLVLALCVDNLTFLALTYGPNDFSLYMTRNEYQLYQWIDQQDLQGNLLVPGDPFLSYLAATYTSLTPYLGHWSITPDYRGRLTNVQALETGQQAGPWFDDIHYVIVENNRVIQLPALDHWRVLHQQGELLLLARP